MTDPGLALPVTLRLRVTLPPTRTVVMRKFNYQTTGKQGKIEVQFLTSVYIQGTVPLTVNRCCSYSTTIGTAGFISGGGEGGLLPPLRNGLPPLEISFAVLKICSYIIENQ